jgi:hypothetical protein
MGKLIPMTRFRPLRVAAPPLAPAGERDLDWELAPVAALLFLASLARVVSALWRHEPFETEPTLALAFVVGLPWLGWRWFRKTP